nr:endogenous retrovirus group K member 6 Env polyprotein-like [Dasypus novemcinctus]
MYGVKNRTMINFSHNNTKSLVTLFPSYQYQEYKYPSYSCPKRNADDMLRWYECHMGRGSVVFNDSYGIVWESAPMGNPNKYKGRFIWYGINSLGQQISNMQYPFHDSLDMDEKVIFTKNNSDWKNIGKWVPLPWCNSTGIHDQKQIWKVFLGVASTSVWKGSKSMDGQYLQLDQIHHFQSCVRDPHVFVVGKATITENALFYKDGALYTCLSENILQNGDIITMAHQRRGVWIPVKMNQMWQSSPESHLLFHLAQGLLKRSKRFLGLLIAGILGLIGVITAAATAAVALHEMVQTQQYVHDWHKNASDLWHSQEHIDEGLNNRVSDLESAVLHLGDQVYNLNMLRGLKCDWNESNFCITPLDYNMSTFQWNKIRNHLLGHKGNMSLEIEELQKKILEMSHNQIYVDSDKDIFNDLISHLNKFNPVDWWKSQHFLSALGIGICVLILVLMVVACLGKGVCQRLHRVDTMGQANNIVLAKTLQ